VSRAGGQGQRRRQQVREREAVSHPGRRAGDAAAARAFVATHGPEIPLAAGGITWPAVAAKGQLVGSRLVSPRTSRILLITS
jgi:hypothetical protein